MADNIYDAKMIIEVFNERHILLYGAGEYGSIFMKRFPKIHVSFVIDQNKSGKINGIKIIAPKEIIQHRKDEKIIIASPKYWVEILDKLHELSFDDDDLIVWNPHEKIDDNIKNFINHNERLWKNKKITSQYKILIPYEEAMDIFFAPLAYAANYVANKYNSEIWCYIRYKRKKELYFRSINEIYKSINMEGVLDVELTASQKERANLIVESVWPKIIEQKDWARIKIYDIDFGMSLIRDYMRFYIPDFNPKSNALKNFFYRRVEWIIFWYDYFKEVGDIKCVILWDGVCRESYLRDIAISFGIPVYAFHYTAANKCILNHHFGLQFKYYKEFFYKLSAEEQKFGIEWAKRKLAARLRGDTSDISYMRCSVYNAEKKGSILESNDRIKVMICPHTFQDDIYGNGWQIFSSVFEWMCYLGEVSNKTNYDWYLKPHPVSDERDEKINDMIVKKYPKIKLLPKMVSPIQLKNEGMKFALTIWGTIGHEYPAFGIQVINAGNNPHIAFDFDWNPKDRKEYDELIFNLDKLKKKVDMEDIYKFYCINYLFYKHPNEGRQNVFFSKPEDFPAPQKPDDYTSDKLRKYLDSWKVGDHEITMDRTKELFEEMDLYSEEVFYKNEIK